MSLAELKLCIHFKCIVASFFPWDRSASPGRAQGFPHRGQLVTAVDGTPPADRPVVAVLFVAFKYTSCESDTQYSSGAAAC